MRARLAPLVVAFTSVLLGPLLACASYTHIPDAARARMNEKHQGELLFLKQSLYAGTFYDDDRYRLVHPRRFDELTYLVDVEGNAIVPAAANEIIPAGTRVRVEKIEWPDGNAVFRRPLLTPRYTTWIYLRVAAKRGSDVTIERSERHILLLPAGVDDEATFEKWLGASLAATDPNPWLLSLPDDQRRAIENKRAVVGMDYEALTAALGIPDRLRHDDSVPGKVVQTGTWGPLTVVLEGGVVTALHEPPTTAPATTTPTTAPATTTPPATTAPATTTPATTTPATTAPEGERFDG
jgi:hypothetical protein